VYGNKFAIPAVLCAILVGGCMTTGSKCLVTVSNSSDAPVSDVVVEVRGIPMYSAPAIQPHSDAAYKPLSDGMSAPPRVSWKNKEGKLTSREIKLARALPMDFHGRLLFQIEGASEVRLFVMPEDEANASSIPWGNSGNWDGSIFIPGMNQE
jgi:hypothetical protein